MTFVTRTFQRCISLRGYRQLSTSLHEIHSLQPGLAVMPRAMSIDEQNAIIAGIMEMSAGFYRDSEQGKVLNSTDFFGRMYKRVKELPLTCLDIYHRSLQLKASLQLHSSLRKPF